VQRPSRIGREIPNVKNPLPYAMTRPMLITSLFTKMSKRVVALIGLILCYDYFILAHAV
jgi:hypothetical protein